MKRRLTPEPASPLVAPVILYDTNVPAYLIGVPPQIPRTLSSLKSNTIFNLDPSEFQLIVELVNCTATFSSWSLIYLVQLS